jgi:hypothetical protein
VMNPTRTYDGFDSSRPRWAQKAATNGVCGTATAATAAVREDPREDSREDPREDPRRVAVRAAAATRSCPFVAAVVDPQSRPGAVLVASASQLSHARHPRVTFWVPGSDVMNPTRTYDGFDSSRDDQLAELAATQHGVVATRQLVKAWILPAPDRPSLRAGAAAPPQARRLRRLPRRQTHLRPRPTNHAPSPATSKRFSPAIASAATASARSGR